MNTRWEKRAFADVLEIRNGRNQREVLSADGKYPIYGSAGNLMGYATDYLCEPGTTIIGRKGSINSPIYVDHRFWNVDTAFGLSAKSDLDSRFLYYFCLSYDFSKHNQGTTIPSLVKSDLLKIRMPVPPIEEQRRIVAILDEAFACIDKAKANAEKNIQNARELFDSYLNNIFSNPGPDWEQKTMDQFFEITSSKRVFKEDWRDNGVPFYRAREIVRIARDGYVDNELFISQSMYDEFAAKYGVPKRGDLLVTGVGTLGICFVVRSNEPFYFKDGNIIWFKKVNEINTDFVEHAFRSKVVREQIEETAGATVGTYTIIRAKSTQIPCPPMTEQQRIVDGLDKLNRLTKSLIAGLQHKLSDLDAARRSVLHQAFSAALSKSNIVEFPQKIIGITPTDLHAGIIATAYRMHEENGRLLHFHHVKAEKIAHMAEAFLGFDLERKPTKQAAGPNDFPRMHKVEHRAKMANYFHVEKTGTIYSYSPGNKMESIISKTKNALGDKFSEVEELIEKMIPMDTKQAEILATTFAAWNNLLIDGKTPTDEEVVFEARDNWHKDKLKIPQERFLSAVKWMRGANIVPLGLGKKVEGKKGK